LVISTLNLEITQALNFHLTAEVSQKIGLRHEVAACRISTHRREGRANGAHLLQRALDALGQIPAAVVRVMPS
jgi:hypothetical protein